MFPHRKGLPYKRALRTLMKEYMMKFIQDDAGNHIHSLPQSFHDVCFTVLDGGHDSLEDAQSCMELMLWKVKGDLQKTTRRVSNS